MMTGMITIISPDSNSGSDDFDLHLSPQSESTSKTNSTNSKTNINK